MLPERYIYGYTHHGRIGVLVEFAAQSDFLFRTEEFRCLAEDLALHIAGTSPESIEQLLNQPLAQDPSGTVGERLESCRRALKERVIVSRFVRWDTTADRLVSGPEEPDPVAREA